MLRTIGRLGTTLLIASSLNIVSSSSNPLLARARAIAQVPEDSAPNRPQLPPSSKPSLELRCISGCNLKYPRELVGKEGRVRVRLVVDQDGNVVDAQVVGRTAVREFPSDQNTNVVPQAEETNIDSQIAQAALVAVRQMKFAPPTGGERMTAMITINFIMAGSEFDRKTRERQTQNEREREVKQKEQNLTPLQ